MEALGMIKKSSRGYEQCRDSVTRIARTVQGRMEVISQFVLSTNQVNNRILETLSIDHKTKCLTYNSNKKLVNELFEKIQAAVDEFRVQSDASSEAWDGVYNLSASLIKMTEEL
jgi:hypothetical protein